MYDVCTLGELLIDFTPAGMSPNKNCLFERNPGGAPANVATAVSKFGLRSAFLGMVGNDIFGKFLCETLKSNDVEVKGLRFSDQYKTTLAFVELNETGDRSFSFYRNPGADMMYSEDDIDYDIISDSKIFHFGSLSLTNDTVKAATEKAVRFAKDNGKIISFDPNLRPLLWDNLLHAKEEIINMIKYADILKISQEEMEFITQKKSLIEASSELMNYGTTLILITLGENGCFYRCKDFSGLLSAYDTKIVDTTGAGDAFQGGFIYKLSKCGKKLNELEKGEIEEMVDFGNAVGSLAATKKGGIPAMPSLKEVENCMRNVAKLPSKVTVF